MVASLLTNGWYYYASMRRGRGDFSSSRRYSGGERVVHVAGGAFCLCRNGGIIGRLIGAFLRARPAH